MTDDSTAESSGLSDGAIVGIVIGVLAGVALIAALAYFLYSRKIGGYDGLSSCAASCKAKRRAWEMGDFPLSLGLDLLLLVPIPLLLGTNSCGLSFPGLQASRTRLSLGHGYSHPHLV